MNKIVPDPPIQSPRYTTAHTHFSTCKGTHPPILSVCPGATMEDALVHLSMSLASAVETNAQVCEMAQAPLRRLTWATQHSLEICEALVEALLRNDGNPPPHR